MSLSLGAIVAVMQAYLVAEGEGGAAVRQWKSERDVIERRVVGAGEQVRAGDDVIVRVRRLVPASLVARHLVVGSRVQQLERFLATTSTRH